MIQLLLSAFSFVNIHHRGLSVPLIFLFSSNLLPILLEETNSFEKKPQNKWKNGILFILKPETELEKCKI